MARVFNIIVVIYFLCICNSAWAQDVVAIVSADSPVTTLSKNMIIDIFLGKASQFPDGSQATPIDQFEDSNTRKVFYKLYAGKSPEQLKAHWAKIIFTGRGQPPKTVASGIEVKERIAKDINAIGYIEHSLVDDSVRIVSIN